MWSGAWTTPAMTERPILSTYRLQLTADFTFDDARAQVDYLARLGVTHLYLSPVLQARPGSTHGYDVADPSQVSEQLGGEAALRRLAEAAHDAGLGLIVDIVPNHLGTGADNPDWQYLLAEGQSGEGGRVFDVDWHPPLPAAEGKVILPVLGDQYGTVLFNGELQLVEEPDEHGRRFAIRYHEHRFPLSPESLEALDRVGRLDTLTGTPGEPETWGRLHSLLERQHYRLVHWRVGDRLVNYRRFFAITELAGVRVEDEHVFDRTHGKILELLGRGVFDGLRIDHPDGLRDPARYLERLERKTAGAWTVVEKILHPGEPLPAWATAGTTGYEFCNDVLGLFADPRAEEHFDALDAKLHADRRSYEEQVVAAKWEVLANDLAAEHARLARRFWALAQEHLDHRDLDDRHCLAAVGETVVGMDVYRSYVDPETGQASTTDRATIETAIQRAFEVDAAPTPVLELLRDVLTGDAGTSPSHLDFIARFQQLSGAVMAKGVEDTVFYRYLRLVALNEVGGDPSRFGLSPDEFHRRNEARARRHPQGMLTTATHDTKRGEDVRLRIAALSEMPERWAETVVSLTADASIDRPTAGLLVQSVIGVWPSQGQITPATRDRLVDYAVKAAREAGTHTNWYDPDGDYEKRLASFIDHVLETGGERLSEVAATAGEIGMVSSLAQVVLRTLSPGVPDTYQGNELWDDSLVDPDNRRPVDFSHRSELLSALPEDSAALWRDRHDGRVKLAVLAACLHVRHDRPAVFGADSGYVPLSTSGRWAEHLVAFARTDGRSPQVVAVAPRLPGQVMGDHSQGPLGDRWEDTSVDLPDGSWTSLLGGAVSGQVAELLAQLPVAVLVRD